MAFHHFSFFFFAKKNCCPDKYSTFFKAFTKLKVQDLIGSKPFTLTCADHLCKDPIKSCAKISRKLARNFVAKLTFENWISICGRVWKLRWGMEGGEGGGGELGGWGAFQNVKSDKTRRLRCYQTIWTSLRIRIYFKHLLFSRRQSHFPIKFLHTTKKLET